MRSDESKPHSFGIILLVLIFSQMTG